MPGPAGATVSFADSVNTIARWAFRHDVQTEVMRRANCSLPISHVWLLTRVAGCGPCRPSDLATFHGVDNSTITPKLQRLEQQGLLLRRPDPEDRRAALVEVTATACRVLKRLQRARASIVAEAMADLPEERRRRLEESVGELAAVLETALEKSDSR